MANDEARNAWILCFSLCVSFTFYAGTKTYDELAPAKRPDSFVAIPSHASACDATSSCHQSPIFWRHAPVALWLRIAVFPRRRA